MKNQWTMCVSRTATRNSLTLTWSLGWWKVDLWNSTWKWGPKEYWRWGSFFTGLWLVISLKSNSEVLLLDLGLQQKNRQPATYTSVVCDRDSIMMKQICESVVTKTNQKVMIKRFIYLRRFVCVRLNVSTLWIQS